MTEQRRTHDECVCGHRFDRHRAPGSECVEVDCFCSMYRLWAGGGD